MLARLANCGELICSLIKFSAVGSTGSGGKRGSSGEIEVPASLGTNSCGSLTSASSLQSMFSFSECGSNGEIGGEAYASRFVDSTGWYDSRSAIDGRETSEEKEENGVRTILGAIGELNDSDRFISGGERSEDTVRRLSLDGVCEEDVIVESIVDVVERKVELVEVANK